MITVNLLKFLGGCAKRGLHIKMGIRKPLRKKITTEKPKTWFLLCKRICHHSIKSSKIQSGQPSASQLEPFISTFSELNNLFILIPLNAMCLFPKLQEQAHYLLMVVMNSIGQQTCSFLLKDILQIVKCFIIHCIPLLIMLCLNFFQRHFMKQTKFLLERL